MKKQNYFLISAIAFSAGLSAMEEQEAREEQATRVQNVVDHEALHAPEAILLELIEQGAAISLDYVAVQSSVDNRELALTYSDGTVHVWHRNPVELVGICTEPGTYTTEGGITIIIPDNVTP